MLVDVNNVNVAQMIKGNIITTQEWMLDGIYTFNQEHITASNLLNFE